MILPNQIETKRLILRLFNQYDFEVFLNIIEDVDVSNNMKFVLNIKPEANKKSFFQYIIKSYNSKPPIFSLLIRTKNDEIFIGSCGLILLEGGNKAEVFYNLLPEYRGNGFAIEAMKKLIEFVFKSLNLTKLIIFLHPSNSKAWKVAERIGMKYMGQKNIKGLSSKVMFFSMEKAEFDAQSYY